MTETTFCSWQSEYAGLKIDQVKRLREFERKYARLSRAVADLTLDKLVPGEACIGNLPSTARRRA